jgi:hypothetical protein
MVLDSTSGWRVGFPREGSQNRAADLAAVRAKVRVLRKLAVMLDSAVRVPGTQYRFGLDSLLGLIPGVGDAATALLGAYIVSEAARLGVPRWTVLKMAGNLGVDFLVGAVPLLGDLFDFAWKANLRNADLLEAHFHRTDGPAPESAGETHRVRR